MGGEGPRFTAAAWSTTSSQALCPYSLPQEKQLGKGGRGKGSGNGSQNSPGSLQSKGWTAFGSITFRVVDCDFFFLFLAGGREVGIKKLFITFDWNYMRLEKIQLLWLNVWQTEACTC